MIMKVLMRTLFFVSLVIMVSSCATIQEKFPSKRYKQCVSDNDKLKIDRDKLIDDTTVLHLKIAEMQKEYDVLNKKHSKSINEYQELNEVYNNLNHKYDELNKNYNDLSNSALTKTEQLNLALKNKTIELLQQEKLLQEREKRLRELEDIIKKQDSITSSLTDVVKNALLGFKPDELTINMKNGKVYVSMLDKLLFKSGSVKVEDKGVDALKKLSEVLNKYPDISILIEGHTDNVPIKTELYKDNWDLSVARATSIIRILTEKYKVPPERLTASGKGEFTPVASNETVEGRAKNRRTEIILSPKLDVLYQLINQKKVGKK
jgi:chemotaxis protein MotB